jgi:hypothetical protein
MDIMRHNQDVCVCVRARARACVRACVCVRACACARAHSKTLSVIPSHLFGTRYPIAEAASGFAQERFRRMHQLSAHTQ